MLRGQQIQEAESHWVWRKNAGKWGMCQLPCGFPQGRSRCWSLHVLCPGRLRCRSRGCGHVMGQMRRWERLDWVHGDENKQFWTAKLF